MKTLNIGLHSISFLAIIFLWVYKFYDVRKQVYVDTSRILKECKDMREVETEIEKKTKIYQANIDTLKMEFEEEMRKYNKELSNMSDKEKKLAEELLRTKQNQYMQYQQAIQQKAINEANATRQKVTNEINIKIAEFGKKNNYDFVLGTANGNIVYVSTQFDITDEVLKYINEN